MKLDWMLPIAGALALVGCFGLVYKIGTMDGASTVTVEWDKSKKAYDAQIATLRETVAYKETKHALESKRISDELAQAKLQFENTLTSYRADYDLRLLSSDARASVYQRAAKGTAAERDDLAAHTAKLDRSLEEGRSLVRELGETVRQYEVTIRALTAQILTDRDLLK